MPQSPPLPPLGPALLTDRYELTMLAAALADGTAERDCVFEVFARRLPHGRRYGVLAGTGRLLEALTDFRFGDDELDALRDAGHHRRRGCSTASPDFRFTGDIDGYAEGELYFPGSPVLTVRGAFGEGVLLETLALSVLNHDSAIASAAARMVAAACGRPCIEMGSRRTHEEAAVAAARAAYLAGFASTSNLAAGRRYGIPTAGTSAHAFTLLHDDEAAAFRSPGRHPRRGHHAAGRHLRHRAGHPDGGRGRRAASSARSAWTPATSPTLATRARELLDELGATGTRVHRHQRPRRVRHRRAGRRTGRRLRRRHLAGHRLRGAHRGHGLQAGRARRRAGGQAARRARTRSAAASAVRRHDADGMATAEVVSSGADRAPGTATATWSSRWSAAASCVDPADPAEALARARAHHEQVRAALPPEAWALSRGEPVLDTVTGVRRPAP